MVGTDTIEGVYGDPRVFPDSRAPYPMQVVTAVERP